MKTQTITSQLMRTLLLLLLFVSSFAYAQPPINQPSPYVVCDDDNDGIAVFDLHTKDAEIMTQAGLVITYHYTLTDSQTGSNAITFNPFLNINSPNNQILYVRVWDPSDPAISSYTTLNLVVNSAPNFTITNTNICNGAPATITAVNNGSAGNFTYFWTTPLGATNPGNVSTFNTTIAGTYEVTATNTNTGCTSQMITTTVNAFPAPNFTISNTNLCTGAPFATITAVNNGSTGNYTYVWTIPGVATNPGNVSTFDTTIAGTYNLFITDVTSSCTTSLTTSVFALSYTTPTFSFPTTFCEGSISVLPQTSDNGIIGNWYPATLTTGQNTYTFNPYYEQCATMVTASITVLAPPTANQAPNLVVVDTPFDGFATFDLTSQSTTILNGQTGMYTTFYSSLADAQNNVNPVTNPAAFINTTNPQTIGVSVTDPTSGCLTTTSFQLIVNDPNNVYIPDANFKAKLITLGVDTNTDGNIQFTEATAITSELNVNSSSIADLTGFEAFTNVSILRCTNNNLSTLNLSNLPNLKTLECGLNSNLNSLNLTNLVSLDTLRLNSNNLSSLTVNHLTSLKHLDCSYNHISTLNVSNLTNLKILNCASNWLTSIDVSPLTLLEELNCSMNQLATVNVVPLINLKTLICSNNGIHSLSLNNLPNLEHLEYGNNQSTSLTFSNLPTLKYLDCAGNSIVTLNASILPLLEYLDCSGNHLTSINVNGLNHLSYFTFALNQVAAINVSGLSSLNNLNCSSNLLTSLDLTGLTNLATLYASNNSISTVNATNLPNLSLAYFDSNQLTSLDLSGSNNLNTLAVYSNQLSSLNLTGLVNLSYLDCHENLLTSVNFSGLTNLQTALCEHNLFTSLDFSGAPNFNNLGCGYNPNLTAINIKNGNPYINIYSYWVDTPSLAFVCADDDELSYVQQILTQSLNTNVVLNTYCSFTPGGVYNIITGQIKLDANNNGCDASDAPRPLIKVSINDGINSGSTFTDANGNYKFYTQAGSFTITPVIENNFFIFSPTSNTVIFNNNNNNTANYNFCMSRNGIQSDLEIVLQPLSPARPGFDATYKIVYRNKGNVTLTDSINFQFDANKTQFVSSTPNPSSFQAANNITWDYLDLLPFQERTIYFTLHVNSPTAVNPVNIGDVLNFLTFSIPLGLSDATPEDNGYVQLHQTVVGSYDPNEITCLEGNNLPTSEIGKYLHYGITFENTGNYYAENVVVKDVIDTTKYDINSIQLLDTSHPVYTRITGNVVEFIFKNINLAAADGNPPVGGHGDVLFKIKSLSNLGNGDVVTKSAKIYFDYNAPIETNAAQTTYQNLSNSVHQLDSSISVYPNPTNSFVTINCNNTIKSIELYDVQGRILETSIENNSAAKLDISAKQNGIYFLKINTENGSKVEKIVKE